MPAPFSLDTAAPAKLRFWIVTLLCVTKMALPLGGATVGNEVRHAADADGGNVFRDRREVIHIGAGLHGDNIAVTRGADRSGKRHIGLPGPNIESCHVDVNP